MCLPCSSFTSIVLYAFIMLLFYGGLLTHGLLLVLGTGPEGKGVVQAAPYSCHPQAEQHDIPSKEDPGHLHACLNLPHSETHLA